LAAIEKAIADREHSTVRGPLTDVRNALSGAVGNLVATGAINVLNMMLGTGIPAA